LRATIQMDQKTNNSNCGSSNWRWWHNILKMEQAVHKTRPPVQNCARAGWRSMLRRLAACYRFHVLLNMKDLLSLGWFQIVICSRKSNSLHLLQW
jgi:hypothetical protein